MSEETQLSRTPAYVALVTATTIAAGTFLVAKDATSRFDPLALAWLRIMLSFLLIIPLALFTIPLEQLRPRRRDIPTLCLLGLLGVVANQLLFLMGIQLAPAIDGALLYAFTPVMVLIASRIFFGDPLTWPKVIGIGVALIGVYLVVYERGISFNSDSFRGDVLIFIAVAAWAAYTLIGKTIINRYQALMVNLWAFGVGALMLLPFSTWMLEGFTWSSPGLQGWLGLFYLSGMTSVAAFTLWTWSLKRLDATQTAVFTNVQPALTALLAWIFLSQIPSVEVVAGGTLVIAGVSLVQRRK